MTDTSDSGPPPIYRTPDGTPFVVFDAVGAFGVLAGAVQIELAARIMQPIPDGGVGVEFRTAAHLRCSPTAAAVLRDAIDGALKMLQQPPDTTSAASKLN